MIQEAYISGQLGKALYADNGRYFVLDAEDQAEPVECRPMDVSAFLNFGAQLKTLAASELNLTSLRTELAAQRRANHALTLIVSGLDDELGDETRTSVIERAESLMKQEPVQRFVRARMLSTPLPAGTDIQAAIDIAIRTDATTVGILYQNILDYEDAIKLLNQTWAEAAAEYLPSYEQQLEAGDTLTDLGVFAAMATAAATGNLKGLSSVVVTYGQMPELNRVLGRATLVLNDLKNRVGKKLTSATTKTKKKELRIKGEPEQITGAADSTQNVLAGFKNRKHNPRSRTFKPDEAKEKVDHQIEAIRNLILQGNINLASRYLGDLIEFHVEHSEREHLGMSLCSLAKIAIDARSFELAQRLVDYALSLGIDDVVILNTHALLLKSMGDFDKALAVYEDAMTRFPNNDVTRNGYADVLKSVGDFDKALAVYQETMARFPNNEVARNGYADVLKSMGDFDKALIAYEETIFRFPNDEVARGGYAEVLKSMGDFDKALIAYEETISRFPNDEVARGGYAEVLKSMGDFDKALIAYEETISRFPNDEVAHNGYADVLKLMGDFNKALIAYEETMTHFPNNEVARNGYADVLKLIGDFDKALAVYDETMARFPNDEVARNGFAEVLKSMGDFDKALIVYEETMARFPNDEVARNGYAEVLKSMGDFDKTLALYEETIARFPNSRIARNGYASVLILVNKFEVARSLLSDALLKTKQDWIDYHLLAMSYIKSGEVDEAIRRLTYGLEHAPWLERESYFAKALAVARIRKKEFIEVPKLLPTNVVNIDVFQKQTRLVLVAHSQAALGKNYEAAQTLAKLNDARNPRVIDLRQAIERRYKLGQQSHAILSTVETSSLDSRILDQEYFLAQAA